ncbi:L-serine ammonia-lyase [Maridesulfovibrio sp.]|uniref:L-serine ammonia-lyase n=1 Tax=Maridesulfovibrio sp. TaxID=2795000 RepID=UPI002A18C896|nr:L-serine ammonia-lyase [Maridesulfovibrio sp.]
MDRRYFLKTAALTAAGLSLFKSAPAQARGIPASSFPDLPPNVCYSGPPAGRICTSVTDLFKIGPGPSSSHTLAPLRIAGNFRAFLEKQDNATLSAGTSIKAHLYGSLSSTGKGHRTDRAILSGLMGQKAKTCDPSVMDALADESKTHVISFSDKKIGISHAGTIVWDSIDHDYPFNNTLVMQFVDKNGRVLVEREYYSTGGGFYSWKGQPEEKRGDPVHIYGSMTKFNELVKKTGKQLHEIMLENEMAIMGCDEKDVNAHLDLILDTMLNGVALGLEEDGLLPAPFEFHRKAKHLYAQAQKMDDGEALMQKVSSYALAVSEGNAAGRLAVTAPTLGSAGTMPSLVKIMKDHLKLSREDMRKGLLAGALVGFLCKNNASVAGAEVGCQGEIGVASAMAAAMTAYASGATIKTTEVAATIALEHHLGMSCDPVGGFVLIPCIERNAFGALKAYNACLMAKNEIISQHWEDLDRVIMAMLQTGRALPQPFKEMGTAGLGMTMVDC